MVVNIVQTVEQRWIERKNGRMIDIYDIRQVFSEMNEETKRFVLSQPEIDAAPVVHGHWEILLMGEDMFGKSYVELFGCSKCGKAEHSDTDFCPKCGAKMDEEPC